MIHSYIISRLSQARTQKNALDVWRDHWDELEGYSFILSEPNAGNAMRLPARIDFSTGGHLRSAFAYDNLWFLNHETISQTVIEGEIQLPIDYSVAFDSNVASYLRAWMKGRNVAVVPMLQQALSQLNHARFNWDLTPFLLEHSEAIFAGRDLNEIYETALASEWFASIDNSQITSAGPIPPKDSPAELAHRVQVTLAEWDRLLKSGQMEMIRYRYTLFHASIAKMVLLQLESPSPKLAGRKLEQFLRFADEKLQCMTLLSARAALEFFSSNGGFAPMVKVSNHGADLRKRVRNVAWDFLQIQWRQQFVGNFGRNNSFHIPYFLTFDRGLAVLLDLFPQRSCLFGEDLQFPIFFQDFDFASLVMGRFPELAPVIGRIFTIEANQQRTENLKRKAPDMPSIIQQLESELMKFEHS